MCTALTATQSIAFRWLIQALNLMGVDNPGVKSDWYEMNARQIIGDLACGIQRRFLSLPTMETSLSSRAVRQRLELHGRTGSSISTEQQ